MKTNNVYIGMRYVPKFATPANWDNSRDYEPLIIVTHEGASYTSKTYVPTGVDIKNETYWALTGNYNAQVEKYREETEYAKKTIDSNTDRIANLENYVTNRRYVFITDSYGDNNAGALGYTGNTWVEFCCESLGITMGVDGFKIASAGAGFCISNNSFLSALQNNINSITNKDTITDIVVCGGCNDNGASNEVLTTAIRTFVDYCKTVFPIAKVSVGYIGWFNTSTFDFFHANVTLSGYKLCNTVGALYLNGVENIMHKYSLFGNGHHPNITGSKYIGCGVAEALVKGKCDVCYVTNPTIRWSDFISHGDASTTPMCTLNNDINNFHIAYANLSDNTTVGTVKLIFTTATGIYLKPTTGIPLFTLSGETTMLGDKYHRCTCPVHAIVTDGTKAYEVDCIASLENGVCVLYCNHPEENGTYPLINALTMELSEINFTVPTMVG